MDKKNPNKNNKVSFEELYWQEIETLRTAFEVVDHKEQVEMIRHIPKMIEHLIDKKIIDDKSKKR